MEDATHGPHLLKEGVLLYLSNLRKDEPVVGKDYSVISGGSSKGN